MPTGEQQARTHIDKLLTTAGWSVQDVAAAHIHAARGVALREFPLAARHGFADYLLYVDGKAAGIIEGKKQGATLTGVEIQSARYAQGLPASLPAWRRPLPFVYESTGTETHFSNGLDPEPRARNVFAFHRPETLAEWLAALPQPRVLCTGAGAAMHHTDFAPATFLARVRSMPELITVWGEHRLWPAQITAIRNLEQSLATNRPRALIQMASGSDKTFTAISFIYRLIKYAGARRVLFLVDRGNLGRQAKPIDYNPAIPIETFDIIVTDEAHRSIHKLWRQVLEYFDATLIGLTATPNKQTFGFFNQNLVMEYGHEQAVADGVNVNYDVYRMRTQVSESGARVEAGYWLEVRDEATRAFSAERRRDGRPF